MTMADPIRQSAYAQQLWDDADKMAPWDAVEEPSLEQLTGQHYQGETAEDFGQSQAGQAAADPFAIDAQRRALQQMQERTGNGLTAAEKLSFEQSLGEQGSALRGQTAANLQDLQTRGQGGGGASVAALFGGAQAGAAAVNQQQTTMNRAAQQRALQSMQMAGQAGAQMRQQSFGEQYGRGQAADYFAQRATQNRQGTMTRNMERTNQAIDNESQAYRDQADIRSRVAAGRAGVHRTAAELAGQKAERKRQEQDALVYGAASFAKGGL